MIFQPYQSYDQKLIHFSNFDHIFSTALQTLIDILSSFLQISQIFFKDLLYAKILVLSVPIKMLMYLSKNIEIEKCIG